MRIALIHNTNSHIITGRTVLFAGLLLTICYFGKVTPVVAAAASDALPCSTVLQWYGSQAPVADTGDEVIPDLRPPIRAKIKTKVLLRKAPTPKALTVNNFPAFHPNSPEYSEAAIRPGYYLFLFRYNLF